MTISNSIVAKLSVAVVAVAMAFTLVAPSAKAQDVSSMSLEQLVALVNQLQSQLSGSGSMSGSCSYTFTRSLSQGATGADVMNLQKFLNMSADTQVAAAGSAGGPGSETSYYGPATAAAVSKFQVKYSADILVPVGLTSPTGYFGPSTMAKANALCTTGGGSGSGSGSTGGLEGGAGDIAEAEFITSLNNEEVGEDDEDVEVAGLEIEAEGSDIEITAVNLNFDYADNGANASDDFDDYATEVSIWVDGEEYARVDVDDMDDDDWSENISLDKGAIIREGETGDLVVAISAVGNLDSNDIGENWNVSFDSVRFRDAQGATVTDSSTDDIGAADDDDTTTDTGERAFSFESFATANDVELHITAGDDAVNDARVIEVDDSDETNDEEVLSFMAEVEGDSDLMVEDLVVEFVVTGASNLDEMVTEITLMMDGEEVGNENVPSNDETVTFDDIDLELEAGEEYEFVVLVDLLGTSGDLDAGDTILAKVTSTELNAWNVEDSTGEDLADGTDKTGSATSEAHTVFEDGLMVTAVSTDSDANDGETVGTFKVVVDVTAFGEDQYVYNGAATASSTAAGFNFTIYKGGVATSTAMATSSVITTSADTSGSYYKIDEGTTERFTLTVTVNPNAGGGGLYNVELDAVRFDPDNAADGASGDDFTYTIPSSQDTETTPISLVEGS